jgi:NAD(P)-dependent dehydrogenase (short-subunit alcohol dehydrogenase family)
LSRGLDGMTAVVTGAARGIGAGIAQRLAEEGVAVLVTDRDGEAAHHAARALAATGATAAAAEADVREPAQVDALPERAAAAFGRPVDLVVCNAGTQTFAHAADLPLEEWDTVLDVNARGTLVTLQMAARALAGRPRAAVVTVASIQARLPGPLSPHYNASKAAVLSLTRSFAAALAPRGVRVNAVAPGMVETDLWELADRRTALLRGVPAGQPRRERIASVPLGRPGTIADVAAAVAFLASADAAYITGECLHVCGGDVML